MKDFAQTLAAPLSAAAMVLLLLSPAVAAAAEPPPSRNPADASASVPPARHVSALAGYRRHADESVASWRAANDQVKRIGGWRSYAREAAAASASAPAAAPKPAPLPHAPAHRH